jgi:uncharacterized membrane protein
MLSHHGIVLASFVASLVEAVEALTVVVAVGVVRGWRWALAGVGAALALLGIVSLVFGAALAAAPIDALRLAVGVLLVLFGLRWLKKAMMRAAGLVPLHDEALIFEREVAGLGGLGRVAGGWDPVAFGAAFKICLLEGVEIVFIVIAFGAGGYLLSAALGALAALIVVAALGAVLHRPLTQVPENTLKFTVGALLSGFGTFWIGEALGAAWPGGDGALSGLVALFLAAGWAGTRLLRRPALAGAR